MKFNIYLFDETPLYIAVKNKYIEIVKLLLSKNDIDINYINILVHKKLIKLHHTY